MDCGNLASDLCAQDIRGSRVKTVEVASRERRLRRVYLSCGC